MSIDVKELYDKEELAMSKCNEHCVKIEAGQILNPEYFPAPNELVCVQIPKVFDQVALRDCQSITSVVLPGTIPTSTNVFFKQAHNFNISDITVYSKTDSMTRPGFKKLKLTVTLTFDIDYSYNNGAGPIDATIVGFATVFDITINEIYCPDCITQIGLVKFPGGPAADQDGTFIKAEAIVDVFNAAVAPPVAPATNYTVSFDVGVFFVIKCECDVQLLIPSYGYCPVPPEQQNIAAQNCTSFNNRCLTPFPTQFFPDQKWNPLDKGKKEDWDD